MSLFPMVRLTATVALLAALLLVSAPAIWAQEEAVEVGPGLESRAHKSPLKAILIS